jgi:hypothetical protein
MATKITTKAKPIATRTKAKIPRTFRAPRRVRLPAINAVADWDTSAKVVTKVASVVVSASLLLTPMVAQAKIDTGALKEKGHAFAENSAAVLRTANGKDLKGALSAGVDVALSANPSKALKAVDAGLDALKTCDAKALQNVVSIAENATSQAIKDGTLIPSDTTIDAVVDAAADVAATCDSGKVSAFAKEATGAAGSVNGTKLLGLTGAAAKVGLSSDKAALAAATAAAGDLILSLG